MNYRARIWAGDLGSPEKSYKPLVFAGEFSNKDDAYDAISAYLKTDDTIAKIKEAYRTDIFTCTVDILNLSDKSWYEISRAIEVM